MEILTVTLKNFKSHSDRHFHFQPGTNAICGENGAGKTSILEAIAWVLFNYRGIYKNEDLIRNGSGSAQVMVSFISDRDGRTYEVQRCTTKGYAIFDPQLGAKLDYRHIEDEIMPWLRQQLGVAPGTDLARLFANTIGVPQGTFTADFLQAPDKRKQIFDSVLKVEEYRQAYQEFLGLEKHGKVEVETLEAAIAEYEEDLQGWQLLQTRQQILSQEISENETELQQLQTALSSLQTEKAELAAQAQQLQELTTRLQQVKAQVEGKQQAVDLLKQAVERSQQAVEQCRTHRSGYQGYLQAEAALKPLEQQFKQRQTFWQQHQTQQQQQSEQQNQLMRLQLQLETLTEAAAEQAALQPLIQQQAELEQQQASLVEQLNQLQAFKLEQRNLSRLFEQRQTELAQLAHEIEQIQSRQAEVNQIPALEQRRDRLQEQLSRLEAAKQFESELRQLVTLGESQRDQQQQQAEQALHILRQLEQSLPLSDTSVTTVIQAVEAGVALNTDLLNALWRILSDLSEQISAPRLHQQLQQSRSQLDLAYRCRAELQTLASKQTQQQHYQEELEQLRTQLSQIQQTLSHEPVWNQQRHQLLQQLQQLDNPRGRSQLLERDLQQLSSLQARHNALQAQLATVQQKMAALETQLAQFAELETEIAQQQQFRQAHQASYLIYLQHQQDANQLERLTAELQTALSQWQQLDAERLRLEAEQQQLCQSYDANRWQTVEATYSETRSRADQITGGLPQQRKLLAEWNSQIEQLQEVAHQLERSQLELKQAEKLRKFISFARKVYKEAGPRITERYVQTVSREADRLFRELLNRNNVALEWTRDYEILVQEGPHSRRLVNLSGGEQMCAALAVRLALLRVLADIDIAFFDEPTTNMDRPRRQSLAEAIANIKTFRQLFVISHDDTFEQVTENVILVEREV
jgi:exonuclease SbcC